MNDKELIATIEIPLYVRKVTTTEARRATYYKQGEKIPKKYQTSNYEFRIFKRRGNIVLVSVETGNPIIKNPNAAGQPKYKLITGQDLHTLTMQPYERSKIIKAIKKQMIIETNKLKPILEYPIIVECDLYDTVLDEELAENKRRSDWDLDSRALFYNKVFLDVLCGTPAHDEDTELLVHLSKIIIIDDNRKYVTGIPGCLFYPIENVEDRKLVYRIYKDNREVLNNSKYYA